MGGTVRVLDLSRPLGFGGLNSHPFSVVVRLLAGLLNQHYVSCCEGHIPGGSQVSTGLWRGEGGSRH